MPETGPRLRRVSGAVAKALFLMADVCLGQGQALLRKKLLQLRQGIFHRQPDWGMRRGEDCVRDAVVDVQGDLQGAEFRRVELQLRSVCAGRVLAQQCGHLPPKVFRPLLGMQGSRNGSGGR